MTPARLRPTLRLAALSLLLLPLACARCGTKSSRPAEEMAAPDGTLSATVPNLGILADRMQGLLATARAGAGGDRLVQLAATLATQLGFDPLTRDGLKTAGLDADRSAAFGTVASGRSGAFAILPFDDKGVLEATIERLARDRAGAGVKEERTQDDVKVTVLTSVAGAEPLLAYAARDGFLLVGGGDGAAAWVAAATKRKVEESLARNPTFVATKAKLGAREAYVFLPKAQTRGGPSLPGAAGLGVGVSGNELALRLSVDLSEEQQKLAKTALVGGGDTFLAELPKDAPVYLRGALDWAGLVKDAESKEELKGLLDAAREKAKAVEIDLDSELFGNVEPGFALALGIAPTVNLSTAFDFDPRRSNPFQNYTLLGIGRVKDAEKAKKTLEKIGAIVEQFGTTVSAKDVAGAKAWTANYRLGEGLSWTLRGQQLVVAGGFGDTLENTLTALNDKTKHVEASQFAPRAKDALFQKNGLALAVDFGRIGDTVEKLPSEAFGTGPGAMMARSVASGVVQPLSRLKAVLALAPAEGGVIVDLAVSATK